MGIYDELAKLDATAPVPKKTQRGPRVKKKQKSGETTSRSSDQSTNRPTDKLSDIDSLGAVVARPRAFYITQRVDRWLDEAVRYLREQGLHKVDRSVLVNALLHNPDLFKQSFLQELRSRLLAHLTNKSLRRGQTTE